jgi:lipoate-protein ligase B
MPERRELLVTNLGTMAYAAVLEIQRGAARARADGNLDQDLLLLVEHPPVVTLGRSSKSAHLLADEDALAKRGVGLYEVERGGDVTFHGPGQLVGYPIIDLKRHKQDLHWYLRQLEEVLIRALSRFEIAGERVPKFTGVWTNGRKIASIGVHARDWVTWHGFALNVTTDLSYFDVMVPCGISEVSMTSVERELTERNDGVCLATSPTLGDDARAAVTSALAAVFGLEPRTVTPDSVEATPDDERIAGKSEQWRAAQYLSGPEIDGLRRKQKEFSEAGAKAFAHLWPSRKD